MRIFWNLLGKRRPEFLSLLALSSLASATEALLHPLMLKWIFDQGVIAQDFQRFLFLSLGYLALGLVLVGLFYLLSLWRKALSNRVILDLEGQLLQQSLLQDWKSFQREGPGSFVSRIHRDTLEGFAPALNLVLSVVQQALAALVFIGVLFYLSWQAALALLLIAPPLVWVAQHIGKRVRKATSEEREREARFVQVLTQTLSAFRILRALVPLQPPTLATNRQALGAYLDSTYKNHQLLTLQQTWNDLFMNLANTLSLIVGGYFVLIRELTFGGFLAFVNAFWRAVGNIFSILNTVPEFHRYAEILERIEALASLTPTPYARPSPVARVQNARLSYDGKAVLDISRFEVRPGERLLLQGPNGSGKTSLLHILSGYMAPDQGEVALPERVASLTAPVELPPLPVKELIPDPALREALGLAEVVDQDGETLSSGQKQKAAIGALLSQEADLYILDEPLANLDDQSKGKVMELILKQTAGKTLLVVLHGEGEFHSRFDRTVNMVEMQGSALRNLVQ
jgi:ATP-binding cassette subfamily B protein